MDADLVAVDADLQPVQLWARGERHIRDGNCVRRGRFEAVGA